MLLRRALPFLHRLYSQSTNLLPRKTQRVRDHAFDNIMEIQKKIRKTLQIQSIILLSSPSLSLPLSRLETLARRQFAFTPFQAGKFILKHPHVFHVFEHPVHRLLFVQATTRAKALAVEENKAMVDDIPNAAQRLRKLLLLASPSFRLRLEHLRIARRDLGLPDDFEQSVVLAYPGFFRLVAKMEEPEEGRSKYVEFVEPEDEREKDGLKLCAIEVAREREYRARGGDAEDSRFGFLVNFPPGFKIGKYYRIAVWKWQRLPYWSPYEDVSGYDLRSLEAKRRLEKRAVAMIHEFLSLTVEKRTTLERIAQFRQAMGLPKKLKEFLLQHQGIFYVSTRGNGGKLHTVFLREAYRKGEMVEPNELYLARRKLGELLLMSPKKVNLDRMITSMGRGGNGHNVVGSAGKELARYQDHGESDDSEDSGSDSGVESQFLD